MEEQGMDVQLHSVSVSYKDFEFGTCCPYRMAVLGDNYKR